ncbi:MAG: hypothetical protein L0Z53_23735 [Acidobacteriales bacterium]|nr:hypothetical protein [Terriglobales bacterium]
MKTHHVEVDEEVFQYVKRHAEPLVDSFNTAVRRLLDLEGAPKISTRTASPSGGNGSVPPGTPKALAQILEVAGLVIRSNWSRTDATREVARRRQVTQQAVNDKYGRQLGLTADQFDRLLGQPGLQDLKKLLNEKFPDHRDVVNKWFA